MVKKQRLYHYEYPLKDSNGRIYFGEYTIKEGINPLGYKGERLTQKFTTLVKFNI